jgi:hypothetical protein
MKLNKTSKILAVLITGLGIQLAGNAQIYTLPEQTLSPGLLAIDDLDYGGVG